MSLVSRATRFLAIMHLFSSISFTCVEDFEWWLSMLERTPDLANLVQRVKFDDRDTTRSRRCLGRRSVRRLSESSIAPIIPPLPRVHLVEWNARGEQPPIQMMTAHMSLFPHLQRLQLTNTFFASFARFAALVGACGQLRCLSFKDITAIDVPQSDSESPVEFTPSDPITPDLTALDELRVQGFDTEPGYGEFVARLIQEYPPTQLQTLIFGHVLEDMVEACSLAATETLLKLAAPSLVNLVLAPSFLDPSNDHISAMFGRLPVFAALETLTIWLGPNQLAEAVVNTLQGAPNLTRLNFRIPLYHDYYEEVRDELIGMLFEVFPWHGADSMKTVVTRKFSSCRKIAFQFCAPCDSEVHFRRGARRRLERRLEEELEESGADLDGEYLQMEWLDEDFRPIVYRATNGKPFWAWTTTLQLEEPETEASDCESESSDSMSDSMGLGWDSEEYPYDYDDSLSYF
ncbi:hypothetical protein FB45DRAFT_907605 [Roridomyces roridus]|uniref:F-box domain-containing protein n=1 Tax=Roridomyces roridus TaxID=1738132 RepID=A0AAD7C213_9AGAR|nr:hypothetical protein FB45DRAFT_907605 [Roridomyces roridus]